MCAVLTPACSGPLDISGGYIENDIGQYARFPGAQFDRHRNMNESENRRSGAAKKSNAWSPCGVVNVTSSTASCSASPLEYVSEDSITFATIFGCFFSYFEIMPSNCVFASLLPGGKKHTTKSREGKLPPGASTTFA